METALMFAETFFYLTVSVAIIVIGIFGAIIAYHLIQMVRELKELSRNLNHAGSVAGERIHEAIDRLSDLPLLSYFFKKHPAPLGGKGRERSSKK